MTDCLNFEQQISAMIDGELPEAERPALEAHLKACPDCMEVYRMFSGLSAAMHDISYEPPADLKERVLEQIEAEKITPIEDGRKRWNWKRYAAMAAAFVVVAGVALFAGRDNIQHGTPAGIVFTNPPQATAVVRAIPEPEGTGDAIMAPLPEDKSTEAVALLSETPEAAQTEAPGEATKPAAVAVTKDEEGEDVVTTIWIDGEDVVFTADGENYLRAENTADQLTALIAPGE
ncbi:MAG: zf-HC2 domain-containing protein [Oscillospiraceae bacterium]|nr:zf-HC2 domain-containing protein [Oscillospiraceae bacterium]